MAYDMNSMSHVRAGAKLNGCVRANLGTGTDGSSRSLSAIPGRLQLSSQAVATVFVRRHARVIGRRAQIPLDVQIAVMTYTALPPLTDIHS